MTHPHKPEPKTSHTPHSRPPITEEDSKADLEGTPRKSPTPAPVKPAYHPGNPGGMGQERRSGRPDTRSNPVERRKKPHA